MAYNRPKYRRIGLVDELRGLAALCMIFYHGAYDLIYFFGTDASLFVSPWMWALQKFICITFILTAGISSRLTQSNFKRAALTLLCAMVVTGFTYLIMPSQIVRFGVLHLLGVSMLLYALFGWLLSKMPWGIGALLSLILLAAATPVTRGYFGFGSVQFPLSAALRENPYLFPLGLIPPGFFSSDYFPLLPWFFLFLLGTYLAVPIKRGNLPHFVYRTKLPRLARIGQNTLWIYMLHQPVLYALIWLFFRAAEFAKLMLAR